MKKKCCNCDGVFNTNSIHCPNCRGFLDIHDEIKTWYDRYASEKMTPKEAEDFFATNRF